MCLNFEGRELNRDLGRNKRECIKKFWWFCHLTTKIIWRSFQIRSPCPAERLEKQCHGLSSFAEPDRTDLLQVGKHNYQRLLCGAMMAFNCLSSVEEDLLTKVVSWSQLSKMTSFKVWIWFVAILAYLYISENTYNRAEENSIQNRMVQEMLMLLLPVIEIKLSLHVKYSTKEQITEVRVPTKTKLFHCDQKTGCNACEFVKPGPAHSETSKRNWSQNSTWTHD